MMNVYRNLIQARLANVKERGASAVEYGLLVAGIAAIIVAVVFTLGGSVKKAFDDTNTSITENSTTDTGGGAETEE